MTPRPQADRPLTRGTGKLRGKVALFPVAGARRARHPRERRGARADLDSPDPGVVFSSQGRNIRIGGSAWSSR
jgi:hypothetical protein